MNRNARENSIYPEPLSETVERVVSQNGGWLNVLGRMTNTFDKALLKLGQLVDCPFPHRHGKSGGKGKFRLSASTKAASHEGRGICTCMQDGGMGAARLLMEDGVGGGDYARCMLQILAAFNPETKDKFVRKETAPVVVGPRQAVMEKDEIERRKRRHDLIARDLVSLFHPTAVPGRLYFANRGIPLNENIKDVYFHPGLKYWEDSQDDPEKNVLVGVFPAVVSAFRSKDGLVVNYHCIYITSEGQKAPVSKVKKICAPLPGFKGSAIPIAATEGRVLHVTEGVEKGWAIHLATGESTKSAYSCGTLPSLHVDRAMYDTVVIWSDCDPVNPKRQRQSGDGQYFAWELARRLYKEGFNVTFMMPDGNPANVKGRDWEDVIVEEGVLDLTGSYFRFQTLKSFAAKGGVHKQQVAA